MRWIDDLKRQLHAGSIIASSRRVKRALEKYDKLLKDLGGTRVSTQILKERLGTNRPHDMIKVMERHGLIRKVKYIHAHWEYDILPSERKEES